MSLIYVDSGERDELDPNDGWGGVPEADRALWSRYMVDHLPWFPGTTIMAHMAPGVMNGNTRAPRVWKDTARALHAVGFTPHLYYLLAELLRDAALDVHEHAHLFELWPTRERGPLQFRLTPSAWIPWLERVTNGESPRRALHHILAGGNPTPLGAYVRPDGLRRTIGD